MAASTGSRRSARGCSRSSPATKTQEVLHGEIIREFNAMTVSREQRLGCRLLVDAGRSCGGSLSSGRSVSIVFIWMLHIDLVPQLFLGTITALFLGVMTFLIYAMDHPLQGAVSVNSGPYQSVYDLVMKWDEPS